MTLTQRQQVLERILKYCDEIGSRTFTAQDFYRDCLDDLVAQYNWQSKTPDASQLTFSSTNARLSKKPVLEIYCRQIN